LIAGCHAIERQKRQSVSVWNRRASQIALHGDDIGAADVTEVSDFAENIEVCAIIAANQPIN
jgi:hypothetical protein